MKKFETLTMNLTGKLADDLQKIAEVEEREVGNIIFNLLSNYVNEYYTPKWKTKGMN